MTTIIPAVIDGLTVGTGAIPNGPNIPIPHPPHRHEPNRNGAIRIIQPAVEGWECDDCGHSGYGGGALLHHAAVANHFIYTAID